MKRELLLIEDQDDHADILTYELKRYNKNYATITRAHSLLEGLDSLRQFDFDCVLLDLGLPESSGLDTLKLFLNSQTAVPVVVLTADNTDNLGLEAIEMGAQDFLVKGEFSGKFIHRVIEYSIYRYKHIKLIEEQRTNLEEFAYTASHDLQSPLSKISASCELIQSACEGELGEKIANLLNVTVRSCEQMRNLIEDLLHYSTLAYEEVEFSKVDLNKVIEVAVSNLESNIKAKNAKLNTSKLPTIEGVEVKLVQLFQNLISNGIKYNENATPTIDVSVKETPNSVIVTIKDNGIGILKEDLAKIFKPFTRLSNKEKYSGTGIGLATCKKIVDLHNGQIKVESDQGQGSTFSISLPIGEKANREKLNKVATTTAKSEKSQPTLLLIDDDSEQLVVVRFMLEKAGFTVECFTNPHEGIERFKAGGIDCVISDLMMPEISGLDVIKAVRSFSDIPLIIFSSVNQDKDEFIKLGANDFCSKSNVYKELIGKIKTLV